MCITCKPHSAMYMTKVIVAFRNFANALKDHKVEELRIKTLSESREIHVVLHARSPCISSFRVHARPLHVYDVLHSLSDPYTLSAVCSSPERGVFPLLIRYVDASVGGVVHSLLLA